MACGETKCQRLSCTYPWGLIQFGKAAPLHRCAIPLGLQQEYKVDASEDQKRMAKWNCQNFQDLYCKDVPTIGNWKEFTKMNQSQTKVEHHACSVPVIGTWKILNTFFIVWDSNEDQHRYGHRKMIDKRPTQSCISFENTDCMYHLNFYFYFYNAALFNFLNS